MIPTPMRSCLLLVLALSGCGASDPCSKDAASCQDSGGAGSCTGVCVAPVPSGWNPDNTDLLWIGTPGATAPSCPSVYFAGADPGFADTAPTVVCAGCSCSPSAAACSLPSQLSASPGACPGGSGAQFDPPHAWDGTCDATRIVPAADSLTVAPPPDPAGYCNPESAGPADIQGPVPALVCAGVPGTFLGTCANPSQFCAFPKFDGFLTCIASTDDDAGPCPDGWPTRHVVYLSSGACGCQCGDPVGESCSTTVTVYGDGACSAPLGSVMVSSDQPQACVNVASGSTFRSKSATPPTYKAGTCAPSAAPAAAPVTFCCLP